jgi:hypothetical protein
MFLIAVGAILLWAVNVQTDKVDIHTIGAILLIVGIFELLFEIFVGSRIYRSWRDF